MLKSFGSKLVIKKKTALHLLLYPVHIMSSILHARKISFLTEPNLTKLQGLSHKVMAQKSQHIKPRKLKSIRKIVNAQT